MSDAVQEYIFIWAGLSLTVGLTAIYGQTYSWGEFYNIKLIRPCSCGELIGRLRPKIKFFFVKNSSTEQLDKFYLFGFSEAWGIYFDFNPPPSPNVPGKKLMPKHLFRKKP